MRANDLVEPSAFGSTMDFDGSMASAIVMEVMVVLSGLLVTAFVVGLCVKYKTRKDPAFSGTEGKIRINSASSDIEAARNSANNHSLTPPPPNPSSPFQHMRTPSRSGDRKLPEIPPPPQISADQQDNQSNLYATVDDSRLYPGVGGGGGDHNSKIVSVSSNHHPYAKVKKKTKKVEHPYATVKKSPNSAGGTAATTASSSSSSPSANKKDSSDDDDDDDDEDDDDDDEEVNGLRLLRPGERRTGSERSGGGGDELNASVHSVIGGIGSNRQTTPLPPEPLAQQAQQQPGHHQQQQQQHFSGDSQDSSKGYCNLAVREPVRHIHLPPVVSRGGRGDATYATLSETSDEMYAAIEDPTYIPTGTSQSNSDTYAVIDLPPDEIDGGGVRGAVSMNPGEHSYLHHHHTYSKVNKLSKKGAGKAQPLPLPPPPPTTERRFASKLEDMYAKVQKRLPGSPLSPGEQELLDGMPMGASAITQSREALLLGPAASAAAASATSVGGGGGSVRLGGGARPKVRSAEWGPSAAAADNASQQPRKQLKSEINYSDYEVSVYDKDKGQQRPPHHHRPRQESLNEAGYETLPEAPPHPPPLPQSAAAKTSDPGYETVPDVLRQTTAGWKRPVGGTGYDSADAGYETVPNVVNGARRENQQQPEDDYWKSNASSGGGYETLPESRVGGGGEARDPGYEELPNSNGSADGYSSWGRKRRDPGYESVGPASSSAKRMNNGGTSAAARAAAESDSSRSGRMAKEPPLYAKIQGRHSAENDADDSEVGYETIPGVGGGGGLHPGETSYLHHHTYSKVDKSKKAAGNSEYDPGYEELVSSTQPPPPSSSSPMPATSSPRVPPKRDPPSPKVPPNNVPPRQVQSMVTKDIGGYANVAPLVQSEEGDDSEIELDNSVNSAVHSTQSSLIHMSVQQSVTDVPDTPGFHRRSSVVVIEHVVDVTAAGGVSDVDAVPADENASSASDKNVHIFV